MVTSGYCVFNSSVECGERTCKNCGWNPAIKEVRVVEWCRRRAAEKEQ